MSTKNVLAGLSDSNQIIVLAIELAGQLVPLIKGGIKEIRKIGAKTETVTYEVVITADAAELEAITQLASNDLDAINEELHRLGQPPIAPYDLSGASSAKPATADPNVVPVTDASVQGKPSSTPPAAKKT